MAVTLSHGTGNLVCDGVAAGRVEFSIASPADGPDTTRRGKVWGNRQAIAASMDAEKIELIVSEPSETLLLDLQDQDRDGSASFSVLQTTAA